MIEGNIQRLDNKSENLIETLWGIRTTIPYVNSIAIVSCEGIPIESILPKGIDDDRIAAVTATILSLAERAIHTMKLEDLEQICIQSSDQYFIVFKVRNNAVLAITASKKAKLGFIFLECNRICEKLAKII